MLGMIVYLLLIAVTFSDYWDIANMVRYTNTNTNTHINTNIILIQIIKIILILTLIHILIHT
jgi:hypothetical protein